MCKAIFSLARALRMQKSRTPSIALSQLKNPDKEAAMYC